jgi:hypothetical protein
MDAVTLMQCTGSMVVTVRDRGVTTTATRNDDGTISVVVDWRWAFRGKGCE